MHRDCILLIHLPNIWPHLSHTAVAQWRFYVERVTCQSWDLDTEAQMYLTLNSRCLLATATVVKKHCEAQLHYKFKKLFSDFSQFHFVVGTLTAHHCARSCTSWEREKQERRGIHAGKPSIPADRKTPGDSQTSQRSAGRKRTSTREVAKLHEGMLDRVQKKKKLLWS